MGKFQSKAINNVKQILNRERFGVMTMAWLVAATSLLLGQ